MEENKAQVLAIFFAGNIEKLMVLMRMGFFEIKNGSMTVYFNQEGEIRKVEKNIVANIT